MVGPQDRAGTASGNGGPGETVGLPAVRAELLQGPLSHPNREAGQLGSTVTLVDDGSGLSSVCACVCVRVCTYVTCMHAQHTSAYICAHTHVRTVK